MRISDWSSDVCSSDLAITALDQAADLARRHRGNGLDEQIGPAVKRARAHDTALQRLGPVGRRGCQAGEIAALLQLRQDAFGFLADRKSVLLGKLVSVR